MNFFFLQKAAFALFGSIDLIYCQILLVRPILLGWSNPKIADRADPLGAKFPELPLLVIRVIVSEDMIVIPWAVMILPHILFRRIIILELIGKVMTLGI